MEQKINILGTMSGSSLDGQDLALIEFNINDNKLVSWNIIACETSKFPTSLKNQLTNIHNKSLDELFDTDFKYANYSATTILSFIKKNKHINIDYISSHGHTVAHHPSNGYSIQIGNGGSIAGLTGIDTISDFRNTDIALGGVGTPLAPLVEKILFQDYKVFLNLGGIANMTFIEDNKVNIAFDICPVNQILNHYANKLDLEYDESGAISKSGIINKELLDELNVLDYYKLSGPKSIDNKTLKETYIPIIDKTNLSIKDVLATFVEHVAMQISNAFFKNNVNNDKVFISGGGAFNNALVEALELKGMTIHKPNNNIINYKEAILMALLGLYRVLERPNVLSNSTGAKKDSCSGAIYKA